MNRNSLFQSGTSRLRNVGNRTLETIDVQDHSFKQSFASNRPRKMKTQQKKFTDSLQSFQDQLNSAFNVKSNPKKASTIKNGKSKIGKQAQELKNEIKQIKNMLESKKSIEESEEKLEELLMEIQNRKMKTLQLNNQVNNLSNYAPAYQSIPISPYYMPPNPYFMPPPMPAPQFSCHFHHKNKRRHRTIRDQVESEEEEQDNRNYRKQPIRSNQSSQRNSKRRTKNSVFNRERIRTKLRQIFFVVAYTIFIKSEARKLSSARRSNLRKFLVEKFQSQINNIKNWLLESQKYAFSIVLEKADLKFTFFNEKSAKVREEKENLIIQILKIGTKKLLDESTPQKISLFSQILHNFCFRGSYAMGRFWTAFEMEQLCISEYYGFIRADESLQKFLLGVMVFIKIFIFNMLLQPHKFDSKSFPKNSQPITTNFKVLSSVYYHMVKEIVQEYRATKRNQQIYKSGNWLNVKNEFIVECCEPLTFKNCYPESNEYISGLFSQQQIQSLKEYESWSTCKDKIKQVIEKLHAEICSKAKFMRKNLKYKLYN